MPRLLFTIILVNSFLNFEGQNLTFINGENKFSEIFIENNIAFNYSKTSQNFGPSKLKINSKSIFGYAPSLGILFRRESSFFYAMAQSIIAGNELEYSVLNKRFENYKGSVYLKQRIALLNLGHGRSLKVKSFVVSGNLGVVYCIAPTLRAFGNDYLFLADSTDILSIGYTSTSTTKTNFLLNCGASIAYPIKVFKVLPIILSYQISFNKGFKPAFISNYNFLYNGILYEFENKNLVTSLIQGLSIKIPFNSKIATRYYFKTFE